jgi:hypothetical protein
MKIPVIEAVCHWAPADRSNSQGEKNRIMLRIRFTTSQSLALDQSSIRVSGAGAEIVRAWADLPVFGKRREGRRVP